ncbi:MAG: glycosyltransferase [Candidatus Thermoplasmatota archaeon]|nr:glycosyltransferase [Candidatus Thermoplasmatota archaeon]
MADLGKPEVATVIPVLNEADSIVKCLDSLCNQSYPSELHQIYVFDGGSTDNTYQIVEGYINSRENYNPVIHLHENPHKYVANARNLALKIVPESVEYLLEMIGHCTVKPNHIETLVMVMQNLQHLSGNNVGALGTKVIPQSDNLNIVESWIEAGLSSPLASGSGQFDQFSGTEETNVPAFSLHLRQAVIDVGGWDTTFITSQDSDISMRMKNRGYQLYRTSTVEVEMAKRSSFRSWAKMGFRYGFWRTRLVKRHRNRISLREYLPWVGVILTAILFLLGVKYWYATIVAYSITMLFEAIRIGYRWRNISLIIGIPVTIVILHTSFSLGLIFGFIGKPKSFNERESKKGNLD